jgi:hypothetical protein
LAGRRKEQSIGWPQLRSPDLPAQDAELVAEHHDLQLFELGGAKAQHGELQNTPKHEVAERDEHEQPPETNEDGRPTLRTASPQALLPQRT